MEVGGRGTADSPSPTPVTENGASCVPSANPGERTLGRQVSARDLSPGY